MAKLARFIWPVVLVASGIALIAALVFYLAGVFRNAGASFLGPGETTVTITKPGDYTLWRSTQTIIDGRLMTFPDDLPSGATIQIRKLPEGASIPMNNGGTSTIEMGGTRRVSVGQITFESPGEYKILVSGFEEKRGFYLDQTNFLRLFLRIAFFGVTGVILLVSGLGWGVYVFVRMMQSPRVGTNAQPPPIESL